MLHRLCNNTYMRAVLSASLCARASLASLFTAVCSRSRHIAASCLFDTTDSKLKATFFGLQVNFIFTFVCVKTFSIICLILWRNDE